MDEELEIKAYYAGHVLGAAMFQIKVGCESVVYTVSMPRFRMISLLLPLDIPRYLQIPPLPQKHHWVSLLPSG